MLDSPAGTPFLLIAPSWDTALTKMVGPEVQGGVSSSTLILSEVCFDGSVAPGDWIEIYNPGPFPVDVSGWAADGPPGQPLHRCRTGIVIEPGRFLVVCADITAFSSFYGSSPLPVEELGFGLNAEQDGVTLFRDDQLLLLRELGQFQSWPVETGHVLSLVSPSLPDTDPASWQAIEMPGTPGAPEPGLARGSMLAPVIGGLRPNPVTGSFTVDFSVPYLPAERS